MRPELTKRHTAIQVIREARRRSYIKLVIVGLPIAFVSAYLWTNSEGSALLMSVIGFLWFLYKYAEPLTPEEAAFENIYKAIETLEISKDDPILRRGAYSSLRSALGGLRVLSMDKRFLSILMREPREEWTKTLLNIQKRVLPATLEGVLDPSVLEAVALQFTDRSFDALRTLNATLEGSLKERVVAETSVSSTISRIGRSRLVHIVRPLGLGYGTILVVSAVYVLLTQQDFLLFARNNPQIILLGGAAFSGVAYWRKT